jgi:hypothetical protein
MKWVMIGMTDPFSLNEVGWTGGYCRDMVPVIEPALDAIRHYLKEARRIRGSLYQQTTKTNLNALGLVAAEKI